MKEWRRVLELILEVKSRSLPIVLISHNMLHVFEIATASTSTGLETGLDVIDLRDYTIPDAVAFMTGAKALAEELAAQSIFRALLAIL